MTQEIDVMSLTPLGLFCFYLYVDAVFHHIIRILYSTAIQPSGGATALSV